MSDESDHLHLLTSKQIESVRVYLSAKAMADRISNDLAPIRSEILSRFWPSLVNECQDVEEIHSLWDRLEDDGDDIREECYREERAIITNKFPHIKFHTPDFCPLCSANSAVFMAETDIVNAWSENGVHKGITFEKIICSQDGDGLERLQQFIGECVNEVVAAGKIDTAKVIVN